MRYILAALLSLPGVALAADTLPDPIVASVVSLHDGDTMTVDTFSLPSWRGP